MNRLKGFLLISLLTMLLCSVTIWAADKEYTIKSANFDVQLVENGDAFITETWDIDFTKGNFTRFYVERYLDVPYLENFSDIVHHSFTINGKECSPNQSTDRIPGTYSLTRDGTYETYAWYIDAENENIVFETFYVLRNVVKYTEDDYALFCYRFIGKNFEKEIQNVNIKISAPRACSMEVRHGNEYNPSINSDFINFSTKNSTGLVKINVAMPKEAFLDTIPYISNDQLKESSNDTRSIFETMISIFLFIIFGGVFINILRSFGKGKKISNHIKKIAKDPNKVKLIMDQFMQHDITPIEFNRILGESFTAMNAFRLILLDLIRRTIITIDKTSLHIDTTKLNMLKNYEQAFIDILISNMPFDTESQRKSILLTEFFNALALQHQQISRSMSPLRKMLKASQKDKAIKEDAEILKTYTYLNSNAYSNSTYDLFEYYERNQTIDLMALYHLASATPTTSERVSSKQFSTTPKRIFDIHGFYTELSDILDISAARYVAPSTPDNNSGCSSCSSCSSCGGGGAD